MLRGRVGRVTGWQWHTIVLGSSHMQHATFFSIISIFFSLIQAICSVDIRLLIAMMNFVFFSCLFNIQCRLANIGRYDIGTMLSVDVCFYCAMLRQVVCPSVTLRYRDHIGWNSSEIMISPLVSLGSSLSADPNIMDLLQGEHPERLKFWPE